MGDLVWLVRNQEEEARLLSSERASKAQALEALHVLTGCLRKSKAENIVRQTGRRKSQGLSAGGQGYRPETKSRPSEMGREKILKKFFHMARFREKKKKKKTQKTLSHHRLREKSARQGILGKTVQKRLTPTCRSTKKGALNAVWM